MSEELSMSITASDAATANGGGDARQDSEEGKEPRSAQGEAQVHDPQTRFADTRLGLHFCL